MGVNFIKLFGEDFLEILTRKRNGSRGSGCGSVGRAVTSDTIGHSSNPVIGQNLYLSLITVNSIEKTKIQLTGYNCSI